MEERRTLERLKPYYYLRVYEEPAREYVGSVYDISRSGIRILCTRSFNKERVHRFSMLLPEDSILGESIEIDVRVVWCTPGASNDSHEAGFEFVGDVSDGIHVIGKLISDLKRQDLL